MLSINVFGQKYIRYPSDIERTPTGNNTTMDDILRTNYPNNDYSWISDIHFIKNGKLYLLAYEPKPDALMGGDRNMYLYSIDTLNIRENSWKIASNVVMTNYISDNIKDYVDVNLRPTDGSKIIIISDSSFKMVINIESSVDGRSFYTKREYTFILKEDERYFVY